KESALMVLPLLVLFRIACRGEPWAQGLHKELRSLDWVPYTLCAVLFLSLRFSLIGAVSPPLPIKPLNNMLAFVPWNVRIRSALGVLWDYFGLLHLPLVLAADYSYDQVPLPTSWFDGRVVAGTLLVVIAARLSWRHRHGGVRFAAAFPLIALLLTANLLFPIGTIKAERLLYLPSVGWVLVAALALDQLLRVPRYRSIVTAALALVAVGLSGPAWGRDRRLHDHMPPAPSGRPSTA